MRIFLQQFIHVRRLLLPALPVLFAAASMLGLCRPAAADTTIALFQSFAGNVNFVGTQKSMRTQSNTVDSCAVVAAGTSLSATLSGIPATATILSAQLYWAASGSTADYTVTFEGAAVSAPASRKYTSATVGYNFYSGAADVTTQVISKRNGTYTMSGLTIDSSNTYCAVAGVLGGFSLAVIYSDASEPYRVLNLYEGFQYIQYTGVTLNLSNFKIPTPLGASTGRIAHITWEGDPDLGTGGGYTEGLSFNAVQMSDALNPVGNQFNSASNINNDAASYGIDFDAYTVSSPTIASGQTTASTVYSSGQDLVLMSAEIVAVPNVPVADLSIALTLEDGTVGTNLTPGDSTWFTATVSNIAGPSAEIGPIVVTDTLPALFTFVSASGTGWVCGNSGQTVTCTYTGTLAMGASLPPIAIAVTVSGIASGTTTNTASVTGQNFDNVLGNNTASVSMSETMPGYVFTDSACVHNFAFGNASQTCKLFVWPTILAGANLSSVYITALSATGVPTRKSNSAVVTVPVQFAITCVDPTTSATATTTKASFTSASSVLPVCKASGAVPTVWTTAANISFPSGKPSATAIAGGNVFSYADVGKIALYMNATDGSGGAQSGVFVVKPASLAFTLVRQVASPNTDNPNTASAAVSGTSNPFVRAGDAFTVTAAAMTSGGVAAPNFGRETTAQAIGFSYAAAPALATEMTHVPAPSVTVGGVALAPGLLGSIVLPTGATTPAIFTWDEVGTLVLTPTLVSGNYLGAGAVTQTAINLGRFYPDHFDTVSSNLMACLASLACPATVPGMTYSGKPFTTTITAYSLNGSTVLQNYTGALARQITLGAYNTPGGTTANPGTGVLSANTVASTAFALGVASTATPTYALPNPYSYLTPAANNWTAPTFIYVRAVESSGADAISSKRVSGTSVEGGVLVASGRLQVDNAYGSELLPMPINVTAQYWSGSKWQDNTSDNVSTVTPTGATGFVFISCIGNLRLAPANPACKGASVLAPTAGASATITLGAAPLYTNKGSGQLRLIASGAGNNGSVDLRFGNPAWLPSTSARIVFGIYRSPLIYTREVY